MPDGNDRKRIQAQPKMIIKIKRRFKPLVSFLLGMLVLWLSTPPPISAAEKNENKTNCDLHHGICTKSLSGCTVTLEINPKPVKAMADLLFRVTLSGNLPADTPPPYIDLGMPGMNMGPNRVMLKSVGPGAYEGRGIIVRCSSGRKIWRATVKIPKIGQAEFIFNVIY
jgi:hypothetical protein